jgi:hypothetical protein
LLDLPVLTTAALEGDDSYFDERVLRHRGAFG